MPIIAGTLGVVMRAHQASRAALRRSRTLLLVPDDARRATLLPPGTVETTEALLRAAGMLDDWQMRVMRSSRLKALRSWGEDKLLPGAGTHLALRKRVLDDETRRAVDAGATQVLTVGAGFDTMGLRLARSYPSVRWIELDHPATQALKRHAMEEIGRPLNLVLHPTDLAQTSVPEALEELAWDRAARAVVIAEGILMYLAEPDVGDFLRGLASVMGPKSRLLGTYRVPDEPRGRLGSSLERASRRAMGDALRFTTTTQDLAARLAEAGLTMHSEPGRVDLRLRYLVPLGLDELPLATVDQIMIADREG